MSSVSIAIPPSSTPPSPLPISPVEIEKPLPPTPKPKLEDFELGYSSLGVATVASAAFAAATLIPSSLQPFLACAVLATTGGFWGKEALSTSPTKEFSLAAKQLTLASLLLLPLGFYTFTLQRS
jgi:hypothetical protein